MHQLTIEGGNLCGAPCDTPDGGQATSDLTKVDCLPCLAHREAADVVDGHANEIQRGAIRQTIERHQTRTGQWPQPGGMRVDTGAYVRSQAFFDDDARPDDGRSWDEGQWNGA